MKRLTADKALASAIRHHSLDRSATTIAGLAADLVGLHNTNQAVPYLSVRARLAGFKRGDLETIMWDSWQLARFRSMRLTMFVFPHELLEITAAATRHLTDGLADRWLRDSGLTAAEFNRLADAVDDCLVDEPRTVRELRSLLTVPQSVDLPGVVGRMCDAGRLVGGAPPRSWRSGIRQYHRWEDVLPDVDLNRREPGEATRDLISRYIHTYGPVTIDDISWWTGLTKHLCRRALESLDVDEVVVEGWPGLLFCFPDDPREIDVETPVCALPLLDPYVQGYRDRDRFLSPDLNEFVYDGGGNSAATLIHRGRIIGVWQTSEDPAPSIRYHLFDKPSKSVRQDCETDLTDAGNLYFERPVDVMEMPVMEPLTADGGRSAMHPLDERQHRASRRE